MTVLIWACAIPGALMWLALLGWLVVLFAQPRSSTYITYGCADCDWDLEDARRYRWWTVRPRYRLHRVRVHHDWPPLYRRTQEATR